MSLIYENDTTLYNTKKAQTRTKRDKLKKTITFFKVKTTISYLPISVSKFICLSIVLHWDL